MSAAVIRVGVAGWTYAPWRGVFYPGDLKREQELAHAARHFRTIEIGETFHGIQRPESFETWARQVPADFAFTVLAPRDITHVRRLRDIRIPLANFLASGLLRLGLHLGPILWRLPANLRFDPVLIGSFLKMLPRDTAHAAAIGRDHDRTLRGRPYLDTDIVRPIRHAVEVRHGSFRCQDFIDLLRAHGVALACTAGAGEPAPMDVTSNFIYCRLRGPEGIGLDGYDTAALDLWSRRIKSWAGGEEPADAARIGGKARASKRDVFVVFDNDRKVRAPANALELIRRLRP